MSAPSLALPSSEAPPATAVARDLVAEVYARFVSAQSPRPRAKEAVDLFAGEGALQRLGSALVRHLTQLALSPPTADGLRQWLDLWQSVAGEHAAMQLPMRLLRVGIEYLASQPRNPGKLLDLPAEERELLRQVLPLSA